MDANMHTGMLWFDNDKSKTLPEKIDAAAAYYRSKHGCEANLCFVNPKTLGDVVPGVAGIEVRASRSVLPNHFWLGVSA